jgi:NADH:ubiquinone oxidoreductase subunit K
LAVAALVLGIIGALCSLSGLFFFVGIPLALAAVILGAIARKRAIVAAQPTGVATAGLAVGVVGVVVGLTMYAACVYGNRAAVRELERRARDPKVQKENRQFEETYDKMLQPAEPPPAPKPATGGKADQRRPE